MLLLAEDLFRLDVVIDGDTLRTIVRNFTGDELRMHGGPYGPDGAHLVLGDAPAYEPARTAIEFTLGSGRSEVRVQVTIGTMRMAGRGTVRLSAQAIVRHAPAQDG